MSTKVKALEKLPVQYRYFELDRAAIDKEKRTLPLSFSSETPVRRWYGNEVLDHGKGSVNMDRMRNGAPLLANHDADQHIGVVEEASISGNKGRAVVRFGNSPLAQQKFQDVQDGILRNVSVGYIVNRYQITESDDKTPDEYRAIDWTPVEVSLVAVPADPTVGVGRELREFPVTIEKQIPAAAAAIPTQENRSMSTAAVVPNVPSAVEVNAAIETARAAEFTRSRNISALCAQFRAQAKITPDQEQKWLREGTSEVEVRTSITDAILKRYEHVPGSPAEIVELSDKEKKEYSVARGILAQANLKTTGRRDNCFEFEVSDEICKVTKREPKNGGFFVPTAMPTRALSASERNAIYEGKRAPLVTTASAQGGATIATEVMPLIDILRNKIVLQRMGARFLTGLRENLLFPKQITAGAAVWISENPGADVAETDLTFGTFTMSPKTLMGMQSFSRQLLAQSNEDIEALVRNDLAAINAIALDLAGINGSGSAGQPLGILNQSGIDVVALGANGAQPTFGNLVQQETDVATANADIGSLGYVTTPGIRGRLKQTAVLANTIGMPVWSGDKEIDGGLQQGTVNGYKAMASNQVPNNLTKGSSSGICHAIIFGDYTGVLIGEWGAMEVIADPYTKLGQGMIRVVSFCMADTNLRYVASFSVVKDALP